MASADEMGSVRRRPAKSGKVSYGDPVVLHDSSRTRIVFIPFFIPHTSHTELAGKIITYRKQPSPLDWAVVEEKSVSFSEAATRLLLGALKTHLAVTQEEDGDFLIVRVAEGTANLGEHSPSDVARALASVLSQDEIVRHLEGTELTTELANAFRTSIRLSEMRAAVAELRSSLDEGVAAESTYQGWCERHSWAFGNAYVMHDDVREISPGDQLDMLLPTVIAGYRDIVELKRPDVEVLLWDTAHRNFYFAADVSKAIGQSHRYLDVLQEAAASGLLDHPEIVAYHPRAIIVIGRSQDWQAEKLRALHGLNSRLAGVCVMTYDQLLAQGERLVEILANPKVSASAPESSELEEDFLW
jgi:hypothetical protein